MRRILEVKEKEIGGVCQKQDHSVWNTGKSRQGSCRDCKECKGQDTFAWNHQEGKERKHRIHRHVRS